MRNPILISKPDGHALIDSAQGGPRDEHLNASIPAKSKLGGDCVISE